MAAPSVIKSVVKLDANFCLRCYGGGKNWLLYPDGLVENLIFVHELRNVELRSDEGKKCCE